VGTHISDKQLESNIKYKGGKIEFNNPLIYIPIIAFISVHYEQPPKLKPEEENEHEGYDLTKTSVMRWRRTRGR